MMLTFLVDMSSFGFTILYILLFMVCLSVLIAIHELGHLAAAKIFKVYCLEYSIGFGPRFVHVKRKNGETYFSLRVIPFGGFVSMYGEGVELPDGVSVDQSRSLEGVRKWKKAIILLAGVTMNAITALLIFFTVNVSFEHRYIYVKQVSVAESSLAYDIGLRTGQRIRMYSDLDSEVSDKNDSILRTKFLKSNYLYIGEYDLTNPNNSDFAIFTYANGLTSRQAAFVNIGALKNYKDINYVDYLTFFPVSEEGEISTEYTKFDDSLVSISINFKTIPYVKISEDEGEWDFDNLVDHVATLEMEKTEEKGIKIKDFGLKYFLYVEPRMGFGEALGHSFVDFGNASTAIVRALGGLFYDASSWQNVGGIIAIGFESTNVLKNLGWAKFLELWGIISVNLAIVNLLPFPGLDGWQLLVLIIEGTTRKKIPDKVKNLVSMIGILLLLSFMVVLVAFDLFKYVF